MLIFPLDLPNPLDGTLQTLLGLFGTGDWVCVVFQASILQIQLNFQPFRRTKCESHQTTWLVMLLSTWKHLFSSYHLILFFTSEPCSGSCTGFIVWGWPWKEQGVWQYSCLQQALSRILQSRLHGYIKERWAVSRNTKTLFRISLKIKKRCCLLATLICGAYCPQKHMPVYVLVKWINYHKNRCCKWNKLHRVGNDGENDEGPDADPVSVGKHTWRLQSLKTNPR